MTNPATGNRIRVKAVDAGTGEDVSRSALVKGYAIAKNEYVLLDKEDFEKVKLEARASSISRSSCRARASTDCIGTCPITWRRRTADIRL